MVYPESGQIRQRQGHADAGRQPGPHLDRYHDPGYAENPVGSDPRFVYNYAAVPQKIAMGNAQDDPGLFENQIHYQIIATSATCRSRTPAPSAPGTWKCRQLNNEIDLSTVGDVVLHLYYTALDGGSRVSADRADQQHRQPAHLAGSRSSARRTTSPRRRRPSPTRIRWPHGRPSWPRRLRASIRRSPWRFRRRSSRPGRAARRSP